MSLHIRSPCKEGSVRNAKKIYTKLLSHLYLLIGMLVAQSHGRLDVYLSMGKMLCCLGLSACLNDSDF